MNIEEKTIHLLRHHKLRVTSQRKQVLSLIVDSPNATAHLDIQRELPDFDRVTLYRTINKLLDNGIIHKIQLDDSDLHYALCGHTCDEEAHDHNHVHFKCSKCHKVKCIEPVQPLNLDLKGYFIEGVEVQVSGVCDTCNA